MCHIDFINLLVHSIKKSFYISHFPFLFNFIPGGPEQPDTTGLLAEEAEDVIPCYNKDRKAYMDKQLCEQRKQGNLLTSVIFTGKLSLSLHLESIVENCILIVGDSFDVRRSEETITPLKLREISSLFLHVIARERVGLSNMRWLERMIRLPNWMRQTLRKQRVTMNWLFCELHSRQSG